MNVVLATHEPSVAVTVCVPRARSLGTVKGVEKLPAASAVVDRLGLPVIVIVTAAFGPQFPPEIVIVWPWTTVVPLTVTNGGA